MSLTTSLGCRRVALMLLALAAVPARADEGPAMVAHQISASAWYVQGVSALGSSANRNFISNAGFVVTPAGVVLIDALGSPVLASRLAAEIRKLTPLPITHVIVTHYHADHIYGLQIFKALGARIIAHRAAKEYLNSDTARLRMESSRRDIAPWIDAATRLVEADEWIAGDTDLTIGGVQFQIKAGGPAHTPEDLLIYLPAEKVLFAGDLVFRSRIPFVGQADSRRWIAALDDLLKIGAKVIVPGHGPLSQDARTDLQFTRDYLAYLRASMGQAAQNMTPFDEAYAATDWSAYAHLPLFGAANRMNAYNTYLLLESEGR